MKDAAHSSAGLIERLAEFRYRLRTFVQFSEQAAHHAGLQPQQHQLLLQIAGAPAGAVPTIAYAAERLGLRHNSVVELANRSEEEGLLERTSDLHDGRRVLLRVTSKGTRLLHKLAAHHHSELEVMGPALIEALTRIEHWEDREQDRSPATPAAMRGTR
ncbi:MAG TPA: MarR family transcriptional regulator [Acidobacteriaceae bacterium]